MFTAVPPAPVALEVAPVKPESEFVNNPVIVLRRPVTIDNRELIMPPNSLANPERAPVIGESNCPRSPVTVESTGLTTSLTPLTRLPTVPVTVDTTGVSNEPTA